MQKNKVARRQVRAQNMTLVEEREARRVRRSRRNMLIVCALCIALIGLIAAYYLTDYLDWARINNYPMKYEDVIDKYAAEYQLDPALVCAVIYTESKFDKDAVSVDGARGLMQIMPETGRWLSGKIELDAPYDDEMLYDPATNLRLGCWYLDFLHKRYDGRWQEALTAYIAGQGQVDQWLTDPELSKDGKTLDVIPGQDVKEYAAKVMRTHEKYKTAYPDVLVCTLDDDDDGLQE